MHLTTILVGAVYVIVAVSGVTGIVARRKISGSITTAQLVGPVFRIVAGTALLIVFLVAR